MNIRALLFALALSASAVQAQDLSKQFPVKSVSLEEGSKTTKRPKLPPQAKFALKTPFPSVKMAQLKGAIPATDLVAAKKAVGKTATVVGTVSQVFVPGGGSIVLLNFAKDFKKAVVGAVKADDFEKFPVLATLKGKKVALTGKMIAYKGRPEVELTKPGSVQLVK